MYILTCISTLLLSLYGSTSCADHSHHSSGLYLAVPSPRSIPQGPQDCIFKIVCSRLYVCWTTYVGQIRTIAMAGLAFERYSDCYAATAGPNYLWLYS